MKEKDRMKINYYVLGNCVIFKSWATAIFVAKIWHSARLGTSKAVMYSWDVFVAMQV